MNEGNPIPIANPIAIVNAVSTHAAITTGVHGITAAGAALIDDATAADQRTTLGLGTAATEAATAFASSTHAANHAPAGSDALPWGTAHGYGVTGSKPAAAAANAGYIYYDTTLSQLERSNGTTWDVLTTGGGGGTWGSITGTLSDQTDLNNALGAKAALSGGNTLTGTQTVQAAADQDAVKIAGRAGGTSSYAVTIIPLALSGNHALSAPDEDGTIALRGANTFTGNQYVPPGTAADPSLQIGDVNSGWYSEADNVINMSIDGVKFLTINATSLVAKTTSDTPTASPNITCLRAKTSGTNGQVINGTRLGAFRFHGYDDDGTEATGAYWYANSAESWTAAARGTYVTLATTTVGSASTTNKLRIYDDGGAQLGGTIGTTSPGADTLSIAGDLLLATGKTVKINGTKIGLEDLNTPTDVTTNNVSTTAHGLQPKLPNDASLFMDGKGAYSRPSLVGGMFEKSSLVTLSADQTSGLTVGSPIRFNTITGDHSLSSYRVTVKGGKVSMLIGKCFAAVSSATSFVDIQWYDVTAGAYVGPITESLAILYNSSYFVETTDAIARVSPSVDTEYELRIKNIGGTVNAVYSLNTSGTIYSTASAVVFSGTADKTVANTDTATSLIPTGTGSVTLAANSYSVAKKLKVSLAGKYSTKASSPGNLTVLIKLGSTTIVTTAAHALDASEANQFWRMECVIDCRTTGATGTVIGQSGWEHAAAASAGVMQFAPAVATAAITIDTTASNAVDVTAQFSVADAGNTITTTNCAIEWLN